MPKWGGHRAPGRTSNPNLPIQIQRTPRGGVGLRDHFWKEPLGEKSGGLGTANGRGSTQDVGVGRPKKGGTPLPHRFSQFAVPNDCNCHEMNQLQKVLVFAADTKRTAPCSLKGVPKVALADSPSGVEGRTAPTVAMRPSISLPTSSLSHKWSFKASSQRPSEGLLFIPGGINQGLWFLPGR